MDDIDNIDNMDTHTLNQTLLAAMMQESEHMRQYLAALIADQMAGDCDLQHEVLAEMRTATAIRAAERN